MNSHGEQHPPKSAIYTLSRWWADEVMTGVDRRRVVEKVREDAGWSSHFAVMTLLSAGIAVLGLLLSSPAVVIGAMLISPLMGPIVGLGFAIATFDSAEIRRTLAPLAGGIVVAVLFCALIVLLSPLQTLTSEISSRTNPNLFDLLVALFSGLAGTYAMIRGRHGAIVGVAIATALMPPLAAMGFGLATADWHVLAGSSLLFFTNLMTIAAAAAMLARIYGFAPGLSPHQTRLQAALILIVLVALAFPLGLSLRRIAREAVIQREASSAIVAAFPEDARVGDLQIDYHAQPIEMAATVITPEYRESAEQQLRAKLSQLVGRPVALSLDQVRIANGDGAESPGAATSAAERSAARVAARLALVAGVPQEKVVIDRLAHKAIVRSALLPGADLNAYRALEQRIAAGESGWSITLVPPVLPLPDLPVADGITDEATIATIIWAGQRLGLPIGVSGRSNDQTKLLLQRLRQAGLDAREVPGRAVPGTIHVHWLTPGETGVNAP